MERLLKIRSGARGWLTRSSKTLDELVQKESVTETELSNALSEFHTRLNNLDVVQGQIELELDESAIDENIEEAYNYRKKHCATRDSAEELLQKIRNIKREDTSDKSDSVSSRCQNNFPNAFGHARLPKLEMSKFSGNYLEFASFYDKFVAVVDGSDLPAVTKFTYLQSLLTGEALASIKGLSVTDENYLVAKEILEQRFGRKERIVFAHIQKLLTLQFDFRRSNVLWSLYDSLQTHIRCLETLGVSGNEYGVILTPLILSRIPSDIRMEWAREGEGRESDLAFLLDFLYKEIKRRERSLTFQKHEEQRKTKDTSLPSVAAFHSGYINKPEFCQFCRKTGHISGVCYSIQNISRDDLLGKAKEKGLCFVCFGKHFSRKCNSKQKCKDCGGKHHSLLCVRKDSSQAMNDSSPPTEETSLTNSVIYAHMKSKNRTTLMQVVKTKVKTPKDRNIEVNILFDGGSDRSFISKDLASKLQLKKSNQESFGFSGFGSIRSSPPTKRNIYCLNLGGKPVELAEISAICADMYRAPVPDEVLNQFDIDFTEDFSKGRSVSIDILIGLDFYWQLVTCEMKHVGSLVAQRTLCGWILSGEYAGTRNNNGLQLLCIDPVSEHVVRSLWDLESIGITDRGKNETINCVMQTFHENVTYGDGRYTVGLPWKEQMKGKLLNNKSLAEKRLQSLTRKLAVKPELRDRYDQYMREMEAAGIISEVISKDENASPVFYMPHRPVVKEESTSTKVRPVFDASAKGFNGISLNDCLETGPNLLPNLIEILIRFRRWKVAVTADVTKAFLQVRVKHEDKNVLRFLWNDGGVVRTMVFDRVPFGTKASPFLLNATIKFHLMKYPEDRVKGELEENLYVDDFLSGADTVDDACRLVTEAKEILSEAGMNLTKWSSNDKQVGHFVFKDFDHRLDVNDPTKVLGLKWIPSDDCYSFNGIKIADNIVITKRVVLSFIARLFDPLGFLTPFAITAKLLFQELWELGIEWDTPLPDSLHQMFEKWLWEMKYLPEWKIPRCLVISSWCEAKDVEIVIFCDASEKAYGCCAYLYERQGDKRQASLVMAKARVAPLKRVTLPRLELLAAVLGARMKHFVQNSLNLPSNIPYKCYTDSMITLRWIQSNSNRWKTFVANRVQEIQNLTDPLCWNHCPGVENPADLLTRGIGAKQLIASHIWLHGPMWLLDHNVVQEEQTANIDDCNEELAREERQESQCVIVDTQLKESIIETDRFSSLQKATRVLGWGLRFLDRCSKKSSETQSELTTEELINASNKLLKITQDTFYHDEIMLLADNKPIQKSSSLRKLCPFLGEDGLLRAKCRLNYSELSYDEKYPIILPKGKFSLLLVRENHVTCKHAGVNQMISNLRNRYWIVGVRSLARKVKSQCLRCKFIDAQACQETMAPLMEARLKKAPPFSTVGIDYAGPVYCKDFNQKKFYVLLFTCAVIRAIHLELVESLSLPDFMFAFRRFVGRRGVPTTIFSDNALTFRGASTHLFNVYGINTPTWKFSVPRAPWWGGWWERMIKNMKMSLKKTVGSKCLERAELETTLIEVEACVNSRPLTFVGDNIDNGHPLTPSHFLIGRGSHLNKIKDKTLSNVSAVSLKNYFQMVDAKLLMFWNRWQNDYLKQLPLPQLRNKVGNVKVGSMVLIREDNCPRLHWPLGVVEELIEGRDGVCRTVKVKTKTGCYTRPIQRIHDLELNISSDSNLPFANPDCQPNGEQRSKFGRVIKTPSRLC